MHIAINGWFWDRSNTGSGQYTFHLLHNLRRLDSTLALTLILPPHIKTAEDVPENVNVLHTSGMGGNLGKIWFEQRTFPKMVARSGADIAHVPYWGSPLSSPAKLVTTILDVVPLVMANYMDGFTRRLYTSLVTASAQGSAHTITISETAKRDIVDYLHLPEDSISVTYLGVDSRFHPQIGAERDEAIREKYDLPEQFVLYLGGFDLRKQVNQLLLAYTYVGQAEGDNIPLVLAGNPPEKWGTAVFPDLPAYIDELNIADYVRWIGYVDEGDKPGLYRLADVFAFPSMYEGFGLDPVEAMASGTPVVATDTDVSKEVLGEGAYLVPNAREMAGAIIALLIQEPLRNTMINQGLAQATRYQWRKTAQQTLDVYEQVMGL